jgi:S1/P1 Nuclease
MRSITLVAAFTCAFVGQALAWGQEGHSIVAEIAQQRLSGPAAQMVQKLLKGRSLASIASWADDTRDTRPETAGWHFVDIPLDIETYDSARDCKPDPKNGDCIIAELNRLRNDLRCTTGDAQIEALKFAVHFVGDIHQPLHSVLEKTGGNEINVDVFMRGLATCPTCTATHIPTNFHAAWDQILIERTVWDWGAYVERLENGWLMTSPEAKGEDPATNHTAIDENTFKQWAEETHKAAFTAWYLRPADDILDDRYLRDVLPIFDRQLGVAGLRLARFLNQAYGSTQCPVH